MSKYGNSLIPEQPLLMLPSVAVAVGDRKAIFLQQLRYWINTAEKTAGQTEALPHYAKEHNGQIYIKASVKKWISDNFPFWKERFLKEMISTLKKDEIIFGENLNDNPFDKELWYSINGKKLDKLVSKSSINKKPSIEGQKNGPSKEHGPAILEGQKNGPSPIREINLDTNTPLPPEGELGGDDNPGIFFDDYPESELQAEFVEPETIQESPKQEIDPLEELCNHFAESAEITRPTRLGKNSWLDPMLKLYQLAGDDFEETKQLIIRAIQYNHDQDLACTRPKSIMNTAEKCVKAPSELSQYDDLELFIGTKKPLAESEPEAELVGLIIR